MILLPLLVLMSGFLITTAIHHLGQSVSNYYDFVALIMVLGGTTTVGIMLIPWEYRQDIKLSLKFLLRPERRQYKKAMHEILQTLQSGAFKSTEQKYLFQKILKDGSELVQIGVSRKSIEDILSERVFHSIKRWKRISTAVKSLAKYPPAFGLMGTVFGLVNIMKGLASASDASKLGVEMSVALIATMYGLLVANFLVNPVGELISRKAEEEEEYANLALEAVLLLKDQTPFLESIELLNSFIPEEQRMGYDTYISEVEAA